MSKQIWDFLYAHIGNAYGVAGLMGNMQAESGLLSNNLENRGNNKLGLTDEEYTQAVDTGIYTDDTFIYDGMGYGLVQHTFWSRKKELYEYAKSKGVSISDEQAQLEFIVFELKRDFRTVWNTLCNANSVREASDIVLDKFEMPSDLGPEKNLKRAEDRAAMGQTYYEKYAENQINEQDKKEFINMDNYIIYQVTNGDTLEKVAAQYSVTVDELLKLNSVVVQEGTELKVPVQQFYIRYLVVRGDTLSGIAKRHGTTTNELVKLNNLKDANALNVDQAIFIPVK